MKYYTYPDRGDLSTEIILDAYKIVSSKQYTKANVAILANHGYLIEGVLLREFLGMPGEFAAQGESLLDDTNFKKLERELDSLQITAKRFGGEAIPDSEESIDPLTVLMIVETVIKLIKMLRERKKR